MSAQSSTARHALLLTAGLLALSTGTASASVPGWSGTVENHFESHSTNGGQSTTERLDGSMVFDGTADRSTLTESVQPFAWHTQVFYLEAPLICEPPGQGGVREEGSASGLTPVGPEEGMYVLLIPHEGDFRVVISGGTNPPDLTPVTRTLGCGGTEQAAVAGGGHLPTNLNIGFDEELLTTTDPDVISGSWDFETLVESGAYSTHYTIKLTRDPDRDHDGFSNQSDSCPDEFATPDSPNGCATKPACEDGFDNDLDGKTDFPADPECGSADGKAEGSPAPKAPDQEGDGAKPPGESPPSPTSDEPEAAGAGDVGVSCGDARFDWYTIVRSRSFVHEGESACYFLFSNRTANEVLAHLHRYRNLTDAFAAAILEGLNSYADEIGKRGLEAGVNLFIKKYERKLAIRLWGWLSKAGPRAVALMSRLNTIYTLGTAAGLAAVPLTAFWALNAIENRNACVGVRVDIDGRKLKADWSLVYDHDSVVDPAADFDLWNGTVFERRQRRLHPDELISRAVGLRCTKGGFVQRGPVDPEVFAHGKLAVFSGRR